MEMEHGYDLFYPSCLLSLQYPLLNSKSKLALNPKFLEFPAQSVIVIFETIQ